MLGQETTGRAALPWRCAPFPPSCGTPHACAKLCPDAWLLDFTNPAGLVAQALTEAFPDMKIAGICDTPSSLWRDVASLYGKKRSDVPVRVFGLNHLSWMPEALVDGENVVPKIVEDPSKVSRFHKLAMFEPSLLQLIGMLPNEYLYYYYYRDRALANVQAAGETRGEQVVRLSGDLVGDLERIDPAAHPEEALRRYRRYRESRHGSYMALETGQPVVEASEADTSSEAPSDEEGEGYAGVALDILQAANAKGGAVAGAAEVVANVPSRGAVPGMREDDVVEVSCTCDAGGGITDPVGGCPRGRAVADAAGEAVRAADGAVHRRTLSIAGRGGADGASAGGVVSPPRGRWSMPIWRPTVPRKGSGRTCETAVREGVRQVRHG